MFTYFRNAVHNSKPAQQYLQQRGLDPVRLASPFGGLGAVGYNTAQFHHGNRKDESLISHCLAVGLLSPHDRLSRTGATSYKPFGKECIVFALRNKTDEVTGLYFRNTTPRTAARHFYLKDSTGLYPAHPSPETTRLILTESIIDAASLLQTEAIAKDYTILTAYGTNRLNDEMKAAILELQQLTEIIFAFDNDQAGNKAALKYKEELQALLPAVTFTKLTLPNKDVNETLQAHSNDQIFTDLLNERTNDFSFSIEKEKPAITSDLSAVAEPGATLLIDTTIERRKTREAIQQQPAALLDTSPPHKLRYATDTAIYYVQGGLPKSTDHMKVMLVIEHPQSGFKARNKIDLYEDKQAERLCKEVSEKLQLRKDLLEADLYRLTDLLEKHIDQQQQNHGEEKPIQVLTVKERTELESFARKPKLIKRLNELLGKTGIVGEERNRILLLIAAISHKMPDPLHVCIQGSSGSGKTRLLKQICGCMPASDVTLLTRLSDKALYNFPEHYFVHHLLCFEDIDSLSEEALLSFRELQSGGDLRSAASIKLDNGQITTGKKIVRGPIASICCTTRGEIYEDNMSRVFLIAVDESPEQTKRIIDYQNRLAAGLINKAEEESTKQYLQQFVSLLQSFKVVNPYAHKIQLPPDAHKIRRLNDLFLSFIKMVTIINQYQRKKDNQGRLVTEVEDIETAIHIMFECIVLKVDELDGSLRQFYERLKAFVAPKGRTYEFTRFEIKTATGVGKTQQHHYLNQLVALEYIQQNGFANRGFTYKIVHWDNYTALREKLKADLTAQAAALKPNTSEHQTERQDKPQ